MFLIGGSGLGPRRGGSLVNFLQIEEGQTCFIRNRGRVTGFFFGKEKITPCHLLDSYLLRIHKVYRNLKIVYTSKGTSQD